MTQSTKPAKNRNASINTFPYLNSGPASNTEGTLGDSAEGTHNAIPGPEGIEDVFTTRGKIIPSGIGNTDYIDANTTTHSVFAGNS